MAKTVEIDGLGVRYVDTAGNGPKYGPSLVSSVTVTECNPGNVQVAATGASGVSLGFGGVSAAKILVVSATGIITLTVTINSVACVILMSGTNVFQHSGGGITSATFAQSTGSDVTVEHFVAG